MPRRRALALLVGLFLAATQFLGCGGGSGVGDPPPPPATFTLFPDFPQNIDAGQTIPLSAVGNAPFGGVRWSLAGPGTLTSPTSSSVTYTAPASLTGSPIQATITATSLVNSGVSQSVAVSVHPAPMFTTTTLPDANVGTYYQPAPPVTGGTGNFTYTVNDGGLPPGLAVLFQPPYGFISGVPGFPVQKYILTVALTDTTDAGAFTTAANFTINVLPPLPLLIDTQPPLPAGAANIPYSVNIAATGGVQPYSFSLASGSDPLPAGLTLATDVGGREVISGKPMTPGTTNNIVIQVTDSQAPPVVSPVVTYSITVNPSTSFVGTSPPGDVWQVVISHSDATDGILFATDQGTKGLPGTSTSKFTANFSTLNAGFRQYFLPAFDEFTGNLYPFPFYAVEMQDQMILVPPISAVFDTCPQIATTFPTTAKYNFVSLPTSTFALTDPAYGVLALTQTASDSYDLTFNTFQVDRTPIPSTTFTGVSCDGNLQVISFAGASGTPVTVAISAAGALVIDNGTGAPAVGVRQPAANLSPAAILGGQYLGFAELLSTPPTPPSPVIEMVGFGPGSATSITGGTYVNIDSDSFNAHAVGQILTLGASQASPGLFPGGTLAIPNTINYCNFNTVVGQVNGKFVLFGIGDCADQRYSLQLIQQ